MLKFKIRKQGKDSAWLLYVYQDGIFTDVVWCDDFPSAIKHMNLMLRYYTYGY